MWEPEGAGSDQKQLVHRYFIDSDAPKDHGCLVRVLDHAQGSVSFIQDWLKDPSGYTEDEFLENLGMFLGITGHHIADLCTPVHVGSKLDAVSLGFRTQKQLHRRVERDLERLSSRASVQLSPVRHQQLTREFFLGIAEWTYETWYLHLPSLYPNGTDEDLLSMCSSVVSRAVQSTRDVWHTILSATKMTKRSWSQQPLP